MTTTISDLSYDLVQEILSRVSIDSLQTVRSTCKGWDALSKDHSFTKQHCGKLKAANGFLVGMSPSSRDTYYTRRRFTIQGIHNFKDLPSSRFTIHASIKKISMLVFPIEIREVYQCDGLFLCVGVGNSAQKRNIMRKSAKGRKIKGKSVKRREIKGKSVKRRNIKGKSENQIKTKGLVVWNPYLAQTRWIEPNEYDGKPSGYALGYDNNNNHKVLRRLDDAKYEIYHFRSNSWKVIDNITPNCNISINKRGLSLKGNTYFITKEGYGNQEVWIVVCFDFTAERFGPRMYLPSDIRGNVIPSCVREEQLAVLSVSYRVTYELNIWITTKIEPDAVSWSKFLTFVPLPYKFEVDSFFIDKEKKVALVCGRYSGSSIFLLIGEDGYNKREVYPGPTLSPTMFSYVPSSVQIQ